MHGKILLALATASFAFSAAAQDAADEPDRFTVEMTISDNGKVVSEQRMVAVEGEPTFIEVEPTEGQSYRAQFFVSSEDGGLIKTRSHWKATSPTLGTISFSPILKVRPGEATRIERGYESRYVKPLEVTYTVHPLAG